MGRLKEHASRENDASSLGRLRPFGTPPSQEEDPTYLRKHSSVSHIRSALLNGFRSSLPLAWTGSSSLASEKCPRIASYALSWSPSGFAGRDAGFLRFGAWRMVFLRADLTDGAGEGLEEERKKEDMAELESEGGWWPLKERESAEEWDEERRPANCGQSAD